MLRAAITALVVLFNFVPVVTWAEQVGPEDTLWFTFDTSSFFYEENYAKISKGKLIPAIFGRNIAQGPSLLTRNGNLGYAALLKNPRVNVLASESSFVVSYSYPRATCGRSSITGPNCRIRFKFVIPLDSKRIVTAPFDPAQVVTEVTGQTPTSGGLDVLTGTSTCLKNKRCKRVRRYTLEPAGWTAQILYTNK